MRRWLYTHRTVVGNVDLLDELLRTELPELLTAAASEGGVQVAADGSFRLRLAGRVGGIPMAKEVRVTTGIATRVDRVEDRLHIPVRWDAEHGRELFPRFDGALELTARSRHSATLALIGTVSVPFGPLGAVADLAGLSLVADATAERLIDGLAAALTAPRAAADESAVPMAPSAATPLTVAAFLTPDPLVLHPGMSLRSAALLLHTLGVTAAPVVDTSGDLIGVLSEADLLEKEATRRFGFGKQGDAARRRAEARTVGQACSRPAKVTTPQAAVADAARLMLDAHIGRLVVVDDSRVVGVVSRSDMLRALLRSDAELEAAVAAALQELGASSVSAEVEWGQVILHGEVAARSAVDTAFARVAAIDGVMDVDGELRWQVDDVTVLPVGGF